MIGRPRLSVTKEHQQQHHHHHHHHHSSTTANDLNLALYANELKFGIYIFVLHASFKYQFRTGMQLADPPPSAFPVSGEVAPTSRISRIIEFGGKFRK